MPGKDSRFHRKVMSVLVIVVGALIPISLLSWVLLSKLSDVDFSYPTIF